MRSLTQHGWRPWKREGHQARTHTGQRPCGEDTVRMQSHLPAPERLCWEPNCSHTDLGLLVSKGEKMSFCPLRHRVDGTAPWLRSELTRSARVGGKPELSVPSGKEAACSPLHETSGTFPGDFSRGPSRERHSQNSSRGGRWWPDLVLPCLWRWAFWLKPRPHSAHT